MNTSNNQNTTTYQDAVKKVQELKSLYFSAILYTSVNAGLVYIWFNYSDTNFQWFWFPVIGWGLGLIMKALYVYNVDIFLSKQWEKRKIDTYLKNTLPLKSSVIDQQETRLKARKKVDSIKGFYSHFTVYILINTLIVTTIVWNTGIEVFSFAALSTPFFWGIGLVSHALGVFGEDLFFGKQWEDRKIRKLMDNGYNDIN